MPDYFTDLLPSERARELRRDYLVRLGVVACCFAVALTIIAGVLLVPSYLFLLKASAQKEERLASLSASLSTVDEVELSARLASLNDQASALLALGKGRSLSALMREALAVPHPGVALVEFTYAPSTGKQPSALSISGVADTRNALRNYQLALQVAPFATSAVLPVSAYAKDSSIPFTVQVIVRP